MNQKTKEQWVIPILTGIVAGLIVGIPLMVWGAIYSGVKWHALFSLSWLDAVLNVPFPMWVVLLLLFVVIAMFPRWKGSIRKKPVLDMAISPDTCCWALRPQRDGDGKMMHIMCDVRFQVSNSASNITLVSAYLEKTKPYYHLQEQITVSPIIVKKVHISVPVYPVIAEDGDPLDGRLCFKDIQGNVYKTELLRFRSIE